MSLESSIFNALSDVASATAALIGSGTDCRAYPVQAPAGVTVPYVIFQPISSDPDQTHGGASEIAFDLVQFACFATSAAAARALRDAVVSDLDGAALATGKPTLQDRRSSYEPAVDLHRCDADFLV